MSKAQVRAIETAELLSEGDNTLIFHGELVDYACLVDYTFSDDVLVSGSYFFDQNDDRLDAVIYNRLQELLTKKYGNGQEDYQWRNPLHRVDINTVGDLGLAVAAGHLTAVTRWETTDTSIMLALDDKKDRYDAHVLLIYRDLDAVEEDDGEADLDLL